MKDERKIQEEIDRIFNDAELSLEDRILWLERLTHAGEYVRRIFVESFDGESSLLRFFTGDLRKRIAAGNDRDRINEVLAEEKAYFMGMLNPGSGN
ncbi:MAG: hypothetical protein HGA31_05125 [Candidatus Moranbacteria bacterium]|nr:hypothetical protein [Candidatus Moranbacteria bacterium]